VEKTSIVTVQAATELRAVHKMIRSFLAILLYINISRAFLLQPLLEKKSIRRTTEVFSSRELDDAELIRQILGPLGVKRPRTKARVIMILSDGTGLTAKSAIEKTTAFQYNGCDERFSSVKLLGKENDEDEACEFMQTKNYPFIQSAKEVEDILEQAHKFNALIVFTFASLEMRELTTRLTEEADIPSVDLLGPMFTSMTTFFDRKPVGKVDPSKSPPANSRRVLSENYYRQIEAIEFTLHCDAGISPDLLKDADVIIVGVSRTGKTPLSVVLSHTMGLKVANIPLVAGLDPPYQLFEAGIDPRRVFCLVLDPDDLLRIRENRLSKGINGFRYSSESNYADPDYLREDIANAEKLAVDNNYTIVDVTGRAVEETSSFISAILNERFPGIV
jgi:regulator of PEP synthase PpsR (kinase-PPPase family)